MRLLIPRRAALAGVTLTTGAVIAVAAGAGMPASADAPLAPASFEGTTNEYGIHLSALGGLPGLASIPGLDLLHGIELDLNHATGTVLHDATGKSPDTANSTDVLLDGTLEKLAASAGGSAFVPNVSSSLTNPGPNKAGGALGLPDPLDLRVASAGVPDITATTTKTPLSTTLTGAALNASALNLADLLPAGSLSAFSADFTTLLDQVTTLQGVLATLRSATSTLPLPAGTDPIGALSATLSTIKNEAHSAYNQVTSGALLSITGLQVAHTLETVGAQQVSTAHAELGEISLLGGLVTVDGFSNTVTAKAGGSAGSASFTPAVTDGGLGAVRVAGAGGSLSASGVSADLGPLTTLLDGLGGGDATAAFTQALGSGLDTVLSSLNGLLLGIVQVSADTPQNVQVASDGTSAQGTLSGLEIRINAPTSAITSLPSLPTVGLPTGLVGALTSAVSGLPVLGTILSGLPTGALAPLTGSAGATPADTSTTEQTRTGEPSANEASPTVSPATTAAPLLDIALGSVSAMAAARIGTGALAVAPDTTSAAGPLAYTGAALPVTGGIAFALVLGGAYAARRRRIPLDPES